MKCHLGNNILQLSSSTRLLLSSSNRKSASKLTLAFLLLSTTTEAMTLMTPKGNQSASLSTLAKHWSFSWIDQLTQNAENAEINDPYAERQMRRVKNGHYVYVKPIPLPNPRLIGYSKDMVQRLGLSEDVDVHSTSFLKYFSGNVDEAFDDSSVPMTWATPYALSIMGTRYTSNCPFGTGEGYGDGRAMSIGEVLLEKDDNQQRWEMQLKVAGPTPFCRGADGRAVLRSSIREFLASEAMFHLGISTTRALSLIKSETETSRRPWYSDQDNSRAPSSSSMTIDDPRLQKYPLATRKEIIRRVAREKRDPDKLVQEPCAITCRVAPSFLRVGHVDLFARRVLKQASIVDNKTVYDTNTPEWKELEQIVWHTAFREYKKDAYDPYYEEGDYQSASQVILEKSADGIAQMVSDWVRVGFCQGNFNADNCLISGRTMDYGPFGFMDEYDPVFAKWTGSGEHFGFLNQPYAGLANYVVLLESILPLLHKHPNVQDLRTKYLNDAQSKFQKAVNQIWARKLGFDPLNDDLSKSTKLWEDLEPLIREAKTDWTLFWRSLYVISREFTIDNKQYDQMLQLLKGNEEAYPRTSPFYETLTPNLEKKILQWIQSWREALRQESNNSDTDTYEDAVERMRLANPKYVLREWILADAYMAAQSNGDESKFHSLVDLIQHPYDEGTQEEEDLFYRRASDDHLLTGGTAFMS